MMEIYEQIGRQKRIQPILIIAACFFFCSKVIICILFSFFFINALKTFCTCRDSRPEHIRYANKVQYLSRRAEKWSQKHNTLNKCSILTHVAHIYISFRLYTYIQISTKEKHCESADEMCQLWSFFFLLLITNYLARP